MDVPKLGFNSYSDNSTKWFHRFTDYEENAEVGDQSFTRYSKKGSEALNEFTGYNINGNVVGSGLTGYNQSWNRANDKLNNDGNNQNNPVNTFRSYEIFNGYREPTSARRWTRSWNHRGFWRDREQYRRADGASLFATYPSEFLNFFSKFFNYMVQIWTPNQQNVGSALAISSLNNQFN